MASEERSTFFDGIFLVLFRPLTSWQPVDLVQHKLDQLKQVIPEAFTEGKIDLEKLRLSLGDAINLHNERYLLNWAGKSDALRVLQQSTTQTLAPAPQRTSKSPAVKPTLPNLKMWNSERSQDSAT